MGAVFRVEGIAPWPGLADGRVYDEGDQWDRELATLEQELAAEKAARRAVRDARHRKPGGESEAKPGGESKPGGKSAGQKKA